MSRTDPPAPDLMAGRYHLGDLLGRGGMATVRWAQDVRLGRPVAIKFLDPALAARTDIRQRFEDEARAAARLSHPAVVAVYDTGEWDGIPYLVMELLSGRTLADELAGGPLSVPRVRRVAADVLGALAAAHAAGVLHRDIKPANLLITPDGSVKVADFGIAKADPTMEGPAGPDTVAGQVLGTPSYLAPERLAGYPATPASDVWSVGVVCWEALAGRRAFSSETAMATALAVMQTDLPPVTAIRPDADAHLAQAVDVALRRDPAARWPSAVAMRVALTGHRAAAPPPAAVHQTQVVAAPVVAPVRRRGGMFPAVFGAAATLLVAAIIVVAVLIARQAGGTDLPPTTTLVPTAAPTTSVTQAPPTTTTTTHAPRTTPAPPTTKGRRGHGGG